MPYFLSPIGNAQTIDANGDPLVGGTIETYLAGTTTPETTYTDDTGGTPQGVVMTLNSLGYPTNGPVWLLGGVPLKFIIKNALGVTQSTFDDVSGIGDTATAADQWLLYGAAPTYISATSFSLVGDQTNAFQVNRRLKSTNSGGTVYSTIRTAVFSAGITTVTVTNTSGVLDSGMSAVSYSLLTADNQAIPAVDEAVNAQTGTTYTYAKGDKGKLLTHTNAAAIAGTLPVASAMGAGWWIDVQNRGAGTLTITPTTSTIDGAATLVLLAGQGARIATDGTNYFTQRGIQKIINVVEATPYTTYTSTTVGIPYDDSIPQITEGLELITVSITPTNVNSRLRIEFEGQFAVSGSGVASTIALFQDSTADALRANGGNYVDSAEIKAWTLTHEMAAGTTSSTTFRIRFGPSSGTAYVNGTNAARRYGGVNAARLRVTEIAQ